MNRYERKLLVKARKEIASGNEVHICFAISYAYETCIRDDPENYDAYWHARCRLKEFIMSSIGNADNDYAYSLERWQVQKGLYVNMEQIRKDRLDWIDYMLTGRLDPKSMRLPRPVQF